MMEDEDTEMCCKIRTSWKCHLNDCLSSFPQTLNEPILRNISFPFALNHCSHCLFLVIFMFASQNRVHELNTSYDLNLLGATYYRLLLLSSCSPLILHFSSSLLLSLWFSFSMMRERERGRSLPFSCLSIIPLSVFPSSLIGVWETLVSSQWARPGQWRPI